MFHIYKASYFSTQHQQVSKAADLLKNLSKALHLWQTSTFTSPQLQQIHQQLNHNKSLSQRITQLSNIIGKWDYRLNMIVYFLLATFTVWDVLMLHRVRKWQQQNQALISQAVALIAQCEALTSLAFTKINHPQWVQPDVNEAHTFQTTNAAHPLMPEAQRVSNSFSFASEAQLAFISGSNMSGKSTFLRTLGTNTVLALAGAVVCAESFSLKPWKLFSIMRIHDSLEENTSTFYFEIKRIRQLLQHIDTNPNTFYLLDELLRGTNSVDKKQGTRALIKHLMQHPACGLVASHDLELAAIEHEHPSQFTNYHFDVRIEQEEMYFDYRLNPGVCSVFNASLLLKKIGLNTQDH
jgi:DNA mismatch repair ATPase MutS